MKTAIATKPSPSTNPSTKELRRLLEQKSNELRSSLKMPSANPMLHAAEDPYDSADWADKIHEEWIFLKRNSADTELLRDLDDALERLDDGAYGTCEDCGVTISPKRLEAIPWARYCVTCQERHQTGNN
jgi:DnaK suppressor protein